MEKYRIGYIYISRTTTEKTIANIEQAIKEERNEYICVSNVRTVAYANKKKNKDYRDLMNNAFMCTPDGMPLVSMARLWGLKDVQRTVGPDLFTAMLNDRENGIFIEIKNSDSIVYAITELYKNKTAMQELSSNVQNCIFEKFDNDLYIKNLNKYYNEAARQ